MTQVTGEQRFKDIERLIYNLNKMYKMQVEDKDYKNNENYIIAQLNIDKIFRKNCITYQDFVDAVDIETLIEVAVAANVKLLITFTNALLYNDRKLLVLADGEELTREQVSQIVEEYVNNKEI